MLNKRVVGLCIILSILSAVLQSAPVLLGNSFSFAVFLSGLPVYIAARQGCGAGITVFFAAAALSLYMNVIEALFFICTNGIIGISSGIMQDRFNSIYYIPVPSALLVVVMLFAVNYPLGIRIFDTSVIKAPILQAIALLPILYAYCLIYLKTSMSAAALLHRSIKFINY